MTGQPCQPLGAGGQEGGDGDIQADPDRELDHHRPQAANGVDPHLLVQLHGLLGDPGPILAIPGLNGLQPRLEVRHFLGRADLLQCQGQGCQAHQDGEDDDGDTEVPPHEGVQHHQAVLHGVEDDLVPQDRDDFHCFAASGLLLAAGLGSGLPQFLCSPPC